MVRIGAFGEGGKERILARACSENILTADCADNADKDQRFRKIIDSKMKNLIFFLYISEISEICGQILLGVFAPLRENIFWLRLCCSK